MNAKNQELKEFTKSYLEKHTFLNSRVLAREYDDTSNKEKPPSNLVYRFGQEI